MFSAETTSPPGGVVVAAVAAARVWSSTGFLLVLDVVHEAQFFQNPMVSAGPPGGGVLSTVNVVVCPACATKSVQTVMLLTFGFGRVGVVMLPGTNRFPPRLVFQPGNTSSHISSLFPPPTLVVKLILPPFPPF